MKSRHFFVAALVVLAAAALQGVAEKTTVESTKPEANKAFGDVVDPDGDCRIEQHEGAVTIEIPGTHHDLTHTEKYTKLNAPRVLKEVVGDFTLSAQLEAFLLPGKVKSSGGDYAFLSGGLLVWHDQDNYARLERAATADSGQPFFWLEIFRDGRPKVQELRPVKGKADQPVWLKAARRGEAIVFSSSNDGKQWQEIHELRSELPATLKIGFAAVNSTTGKHTASFRDIEVSQP